MSSEPKLVQTSELNYRTEVSLRKPIQSENDTYIYILQFIKEAENALNILFILSHSSLCDTYSQFYKNLFTSLNIEFISNIVFEIL